MQTIRRVESRGSFDVAHRVLTTARGAFYRHARLIGEAVSADGVGALAAGVTFVIGRVIGELTGLSSTGLG